MRGQTSMIAIVIAIMLVIFIMIFMFTNIMTTQTGQSVKSEQMNLYTTNLLLSLLNTDTDCGSMSDIIKSRYFGGRGSECNGEELDYRIDYYITDVLAKTGNTGYSWLLETTPKNFQFTTMQWGDADVTSEPGYWDARTLLSSGSNQLEVKLYIRTN